jgi:hypothetical protein
MSPIEALQKALRPHNIAGTWRRAGDVAHGRLPCWRIGWAALYHPVDSAYLAEIWR